MSTTAIPTTRPVDQPLRLPPKAGSALRPGRSLAAVLAMGLVCAVAAAPAIAGSRRVPTLTRLAVLQSPHAVHEEPEVSSPQVSVLPALTPITGQRTTLPVTGSLTGADGVAWLKVMLPGRPNSSTGWIAQNGTRRSLTEWHLVVNLGARRISVYREGRVVKKFSAVVGKPSTPTPTGEFFVEESLVMAAREPGGPFALALSARSNSLQEFEGGPGQIAIHGRDNLGGTLGAAESHGCVRLATSSIDWLSTRIGAGTPVTIDEG
jgi:lipoprotein-anchoring transpeptidase ErfK/SrfK